MSNKLPKSVSDDLFEETLNSLERGAGIRAVGLTWSSGFAILVLLLMAVFEGITPQFFIALMVAATSNCIIWAIYSVSASLNLQCDTITHLIVHYSESKKKD